MSRSYHQRHSTSRRGKCPREILGTFTKDGKTHLIFRKRKMKPYGRKNFIGYGEEVYSSKFGEYSAPVTDKKRERREAMRQIIKEVDE